MNAIENTIKIPIGGRQKVCPDEVIMFEADINYSIAHLKNGSKLIVATTLKKIEERFGKYDFFRANKSYIVNQKFILESNGNILKLTNSYIINFSRRKGRIWKERIFI